MKNLLIVIVILIVCASVFAVDANTIVYSAVKLPRGAVIDSNGTFHWTPDYTQAGVYNNIIFVVTKGTTKVYSNPISITVAAVPRTPWWKVLLNLFTKEAQPVRVSLTPYVVDPDINQPNVFDANFK